MMKMKTTDIYEFRVRLKRALRQSETHFESDDDTTTLISLLTNWKLK